MIAKRIQVYGRVQGVGFRWSTCMEARRLGVDGWVCNRRDGSVEILAQGNVQAVIALVDWARHGPAYARVERLDEQDCPVTALKGFTEQSKA